MALVWLALTGTAPAQAQDPFADEPEDALDAEDDVPEEETADPTADPESTAGEPEDGDSDLEPAEADVEPAPPESAVRVEVAAGAGAGTRSFLRPTPGGAQRLPETVFPAVDIAIRVHAWPQDTFSLGVLLRYQSSIGLTVEEQPLFALENRIAARAERVELSAAPTLRLGDDSAFAVAFPVGATMRTFWPEVHELATPGYSLIGPHARAELVVQLGSILSFRIGPEVHAILAIDQALRDEGVDRFGVAYGGEALVRFALFSVFALELTYRESHAFVPTIWTGRHDFEDVERFATLRLAGAF